MSKYKFVLDVESVGLQGEGYSVGYVVLDESWGEVDSKLLYCYSDYALGSCNDREWVKEHVDPNLPQYSTHESLISMRTDFWKEWMVWKNKGATMWADCCFPVETNFLTACVNDFHSLPERNSDSSINKPRVWQSPYPLHEIATVMLIAGLDPLANYTRLQSELPKHNPLADARQSARLLQEALTIIGNK